MAHVFQILGIALLGIGGFLLLLRVLLPRLGTPENVPAQAFFDTIDKIILFAFILGLVGLMTFGLLQVSDRASAAMGKAIELNGQLTTLQAQHSDLSGKYEQLKKDDGVLRARVDEIQEAGLKSRSSGIEIISTDVKYDLTNWHLVTPSMIDKQKESELIWTTTRKIWRAQKETTKFSATFATSSPLPPVFNCKTHPMGFEENRDPFPQGKENLHRWILTYDISAVELFKEVDVVTQITAWNSMQNPDIEHEGTLMLYPTRHASLQVIFPQTKHAKPNGVHCYYYGLATPAGKLPFPNPKLEYVPDGSKVTWTIDDPRLGYHYEIWWEW